MVGKNYIEWVKKYTKSNRSLHQKKLDEKV